MHPDPRPNNAHPGSVSSHVLRTLCCPDPIPHLEILEPSFYTATQRTSSHNTYENPFRLDLMSGDGTKRVDFANEGVVEEDSEMRGGGVVRDSEGTFGGSSWDSMRLNRPGVRVRAQDAM
jgi:hypothetical protein